MKFVDYNVEVCMVAAAKVSCLSHVQYLIYEILI